MSFHCDKLCSGECCFPLLKALVLVLRDHVSCAHIPNVARGDVFGAATNIMAHAAIDDPAELAELMVSGLRARGMRVGDGRSNTYDIHLFVVSDVSMIHVISDVYNFLSHKQFTMSQARERLLAIMRVPADPSSREACETILRSEP